jgi:thioredoxin-like negative regulator of GroEL
MLPVEKAHEALKKLAWLHLGDATEAMKIHFDLARLAKAHPHDVALRTAMAEACQIIGWRGEALEHLHAAAAFWP